MKKTFLLCLSVVLAFSCSKGVPSGKEAGKSGGQYLVKINDSTLTKEDVAEEFGMLPAEAQQLFAEEVGMEKLVEELAKKEILYLESVKRGIGNTEKFKKKLESFKKRLMVETLLEQEVTDKATVTDKELQDFYSENKENFMRDPSGTGKPRAMEFEKVKDLIRQYLLAEKQKEMFDSYIASLKKQYTVDINRDAVRQAFGNASGKAAGEAGPGPAAK